MACSEAPRHSSQRLKTSHRIVQKKRILITQDIIALTKDGEAVGDHVLQPRIEVKRSIQLNGSESGRDFFVISGHHTALSNKVYIKQQLAINIKREETPKAESTEDAVASTEPENPTQSYTPMEREETPQNEYNTSSYYNNEDDDSSPWPKILGILAILLVVGGAVWYFGFYQPQQKQAREKAQQEELAREEARKREADLAEQKRLADETRAADSLAALAPAAGVVDTLSERTGRYYVIVASGIDGDLIMDYAKKLATKGLSPKIILPYGKVKFHRLAIAEGDTYASTQATADQLKSEYSGGAWVVKY